MSLRRLYAARLSGAELMEIARATRAMFANARELEIAVGAVTRRMGELYTLLGQQIYSCNEMRRRTAAFNRGIYEQLKLADLSRPIRTVKNELVTLDTLSHEDVRDFLYRPGRLEANHIVQNAYFDKHADAFKAFAKLIEGADDPRFRKIDATWWTDAGRMPAIAWEAELHTVAPARIAELYGTRLPMTKSLSSMLDNRVAARLGGSPKLSEIFDAHLAVYRELFVDATRPTGRDLLSTLFTFGAGEVRVTATFEEYLVSRIALARSAGM